MNLLSEKWTFAYVDLMSRTRVLSQGAAFMLLVFAVLEGLSVINAVRLAENLNSAAVVRGSIPPLAYVLGFGARFVYLMRSDLSPRGLFLTILGCLAAILISWVAIQGMFHPYNMPLETLGMLFLVFAVLRFLVTSAVAFFDSDEFSPNS